MEDKNTWGLGSEERGHNSQYAKVQGIFFEPVTGEISLFGGVLVLGFDLLGEWCGSLLWHVLTPKGIPIRPRSHSRLDC